MSDNTPKIDEISGTETTGHEWDGIEELNTPMPRWWLWVFYASILFAIAYAIAMPSIPLVNSYYKGLLGASDRKQVAQEVELMGGQKYELFNQLNGETLEGIEAKPELFRFAMAAGKSAFGDNCATCHGSGGQGFKGYPNLNDDVWLWGGTFEDIRQTLTVGIRSAHDDTRFNIMMAYGREGFLTNPQIDDLTQYVLNLSGQEAEQQAVLRAGTVFQTNCSSCHGVAGTGDQSQGAPNLTDNEWLYGGDAADIRATIYNGRQGVMPNWNERLSPEIISALAIYVHSLGGGVATPQDTNTEDAP
ncbi:cytochrome-c oxidase, cbb3-type subunit III [Robiginitomaculum antarcticum]|uniref:cytochrome-c oxidase, cbb3-type subunit III n=1 Tax=Robiginitomaculum antarcticum TaxID=437507 RepID=UPI00035E6863|nr:cytochrome-c oxidase, cbb3-type subunit III [Robiginitomaculum antarcticum]